MRGDRQPVRFWGTNAGPGIWKMDHASHVYLAKRLAKTGVNIVRLHGSLYEEGDPILNRDKLDQLHHLVYALKREGIYVSLSFYFPLWFKLDDNHPSFMLLFFDSQMQQIYRDWARDLLTTRNPYTGLTLAQDPAVAMVEIVNEDSHFFWTFSHQNMPDHRWRTLTKLFGEWLVQKHGSITDALVSWGDVTEPGDRPAESRIDLYDAWMMTSDGLRANPSKVARVRDQVQFLAENMRGLYETTIDYFRDTCGYDGLVSCGNWHVTDTAKLDALERYGYTAGDVIDHHGYFDYGHQGEGSTYSIRPGHTFESQSALTLRQSNPLPFVETEGYPHIVSEVGWPGPNMYRAEFPFLASAYGGLLGLDGIFSFALGSDGWDQQMNKFPVNSPTVLGCFPAAALMFRRGDVRQAEIVVRDIMRLSDLYALRGTAVHTQGSLDQLRAKSIPAGQRRQGLVSSIDPLTFYVGRVTRTFSGDPADSFLLSTQGFVDRKQKTIRSVTGQLNWDFEHGVVTLNSPRAQGAVGFLGRVGEVSLPDLSLKMQNDYGSVTVLALDDKPIDTSEKLLIQTMTIEQPYGFHATGEGNRDGRITNLGSAPLGVQQFHATVTLKRSHVSPSRVYACDEHGYAKSTEVLTTDDARAGTLRIVLDPVSPYHVVAYPPAP